MDTMSALPVKGRAAKTGYTRAQFGAAWTDDVAVDGGHNGCDTRNNILRRDLTGLKIKPGSHGCSVLSGTLHDPYTGKLIAFVRGSSTRPSSTSTTWSRCRTHGRRARSNSAPPERQDFANDPLNLQTTDGPTNEQKGDGDAATWLPPNKSYRCAYVSRQVHVKAKYNLWMTQSEHDAITRILTGCGAKPLARADVRTSTPERSDHQHGVPADPHPDHDHDSAARAHDHDYDYDHSAARSHHRGTAAATGE